jgi:hypothetical protein
LKAGSGVNRIAGLAAHGRPAGSSLPIRADLEEAAQNRLIEAIRGAPGDGS